MKALISVIIVAHNSGPDLALCLADLAKAGIGQSGYRLEVIVVDNDSTDGCLIAARPANPQAGIIESRVNRGFAGGVNLGLKAARGEFLMLLNPDTRLEPGALDILADYLAANPAVGAVGPKILDPDGTVQFSARGEQGAEAFLFNRYSLLTRLLPHNPVSRRYLGSDVDPDRTREAAWLSGAALMIPRRVLARVGPMDEGFFLFQEDVDWCKRIRAIGLKVVYLPTARIRHAIGISKRADSVRLLSIRHRSMIHYIHKHHGRLGPVLWLADLAIALRFGLKVAASLLRRKSAKGRPA